MVILSKRLRWTTFDVKNGVAEVFRSLVVEDDIEDRYNTVLDENKWKNWKANAREQIQDRRRREDYDYKDGLPERFRFRPFKSV